MIKPACQRLKVKGQILTNLWVRVKGTCPELHDHCRSIWLHLEETVEILHRVGLEVGGHEDPGFRQSPSGSIPDPVRREIEDPVQPVGLIEGLHKEWVGLLNGTEGPVLILNLNREVRVS
jgi:hypothetical protein